MIGIQKAVSNYLFKFIEPTCPNVGGASSAASGIEPVQKAYNQGQFSATAARIPAPLGKIGDINVAKDFRWTKTKSNTRARKGVPVLTLRELQVVVPAFYTNLQLLFDTLSNDQGTGVTNLANDLANLIGDGPLDVGAVFKGFVNNVDEGTKALGDALRNFNSTITGAQQFNFPAYLKDYERLYGVKQTNFIYRLPYLDNQVKSIANSWGTDDSALKGAITTKPLQQLQSLASAYSTGVGIDFAKTFTYPDDGPSHNINFFLDNTRIDNQSDALKHYRFIYLLLYQNLPNRINRTSLTPPVIYQASVPGVFSYRWSYLANISVEFIGARRPIKMVVGAGEPMSEVIIPEGYNVQLTLKSLTPETKNLMYDSINNPVQSYVSDSKPAQAQQAPTAGPAPLPDELVGPQQSSPVFDFLNSWNPRAWNNPNP